MVQVEEEYDYSSEEVNNKNPPSMTSDMDKLLNDSGLPKYFIDNFYIIKLNSLKLSKLSIKQISILMDRIRGLFYHYELLHKKEQVNESYLMNKRQFLIAIEIILNRSQDGFERLAEITTVLKKMINAQELTNQKSFLDRIFGKKGGNNNE